ncbi:MAG: CopD family protein [Gemmatimonadota bacterium]
MIWTLTTVQQALLFGATIVVTGASAWALWIRPALRNGTGPEQEHAVEGVEARVARIAWRAAMIVLIAWALRGAAQLLAFRDPFAPLREDVSLLLFQTFWGTVWMAQGVVAVFLVLLLTGRARWPLAIVANTALIATISMSSHAMGADNQVLTVTADGLHVLAAGLWMGTLAIILIASRGTTGPTLLAHQIRRFSPMALGSGGVLVLAGAALSWAHLPEIQALWTTAYGRLLSAKIVAALVALALGFLNWRTGIPVVDTDDGARGVRRRATLEVAAAAGVVLLTAVLVHTAQP